MYSIRLRDMKGLSLVLLLTFFIASSPCVSSLGESKDQLIIDLLREDRIDGSFSSPELNCGIVFNATTTGLTLSTLSGQKILSVEEQVGPVRLVTLSNREFVQHHEGSEESGTPIHIQDYAVPRYHRSYAGTQDHETFANLISKLKKINPEKHARVLEKSVNIALSKCEMNLLSDAAIAMGQRGINSRDYPSTLSLYMTASRVASRLNVDINKNLSSNEINNNTYELPPIHERLKRQDCETECPPCKSQECLGLCGPGCTCWKWTCGNCCYNKGCYYHDLCCRAKPKSLTCLLPMSFDCNSKYECASTNPHK